jgi:adenylyltransferase/sulfurtransferase
MLSTTEIERYKRHLVLHAVGGAGQQAIKAASVLVIGAGGLGSPVVLYLAAAGVGRVGIIDDDAVSLDNLQRQIVHGTPDVGRPKVDSAGDAVARLNPHVVVERHNERLTGGNALELFGRYDIIADGSDNFRTRYLAADACHLAARPLVSASLGPFEGYLSTFRSFETAEDGRPRATYRCIFPQAPPEGLIPNCSEVGVLGAVAGVMGTLQATEVLNQIVGFGDGLVDRMLMFDARQMSFTTIRVGWDPANPLNGERPTIRDLSAYQ